MTFKIGGNRLTVTLGELRVRRNVSTSSSPADETFEKLGQSAADELWRIANRGHCDAQRSSASSFYFSGM